MADAYRDNNYVPTLIAASNADGQTPVRVYADPVTHRLLVESSAGSGTVTSITAGTGLTATPTNPITTSGTILLDSKLAPLDTLGTAGQLIRVNAGATALEYFTSSGGVVSVTGTTNRIAVNNTDPANPIVDIAATYVGQTSITTLGTIVTGVWNGTAVVAIYGGTGQTTYAKGDILASPGSNTLNKLSVGTDGFVLTADSASTNGIKWAATGTAANITVGTTTITSGTTTRILYDNAGVLGEYTLTGTGTAVVMANTPTLITPVLGVATATSINGLTITTTTGTLTMTNGKTLAVTNSLTLSGTDSTTMTFPGTSQTIAGLTATQTFTNKRITRRLTTTSAPGATPSTDTDNVDIQAFTGLTTAITSMTTNLTGTPVDGDLVEFRFTDNGTGRAITWGASFESTTITLPTTTVASTLLRVGFEWNATASKWDCLAVA